jgi:hypothetical protein
MTNRLDRDELISLLETLGSDNDEEALAAARVLDTKVAAAETTWSALLSSAVGAAVPETPEDGPEDGDNPALVAPAEDAAGRNAQSLALIEKLLARGGHSDAFREELEGYKADIAAGEFDEGDHNYLRAVYKRLSS